MDKATVIRDIGAAHRSLAELVDRLPEESLLEPAMDDWTGKDLLAHIAWWHDHSVLVIEGLRAGRQPYDGTDPANTTDAFNERTHREHLQDPLAATRAAFHASFGRLSDALSTLTEDELFARDRWSWLGGEALVETILWDTSRHYEEHEANLAGLAERAGVASQPTGDT